MRIAWALLVLASCKDRPPPPSGGSATTSQQIVAAVDKALDKPPAAPPLRGSATKADCSGAQLDLAKLFDSPACDVAPSNGSVLSPEGITFEVEPARPRVRQGGSIDLALVLANRTPAPITFDVPLHAPVDLAFAVELYESEKSEERMDVDPGDCPVQADFVQPRNLRITLAAGGRATLPRRFSAVLHRLDKDCKPVPQGPLAKGTFELLIATPFTLRDSANQNQVMRVPLVIE